MNNTISHEDLLVAKKICPVCGAPIVPKISKQNSFYFCCNNDYEHKHFGTKELYDLCTRLALAFQTAK